MVIYHFDKEITQFVLENGKYRALPPIIEGDMVSSAKFTELTVATEDIFRL
ncbi:hypothetical protein [Capnocytophaga granulosa]|uniref:hypothetical protein n=1 Tax=Capnocytophaga granulosa TaxID=45242 RepID=UPI003857741C